MSKKSSTLLRNLSFFLSLAVLLTGCNFSEGGGSFNWDLPRKAEDHSCDDVGIMASSYCFTGKYPHLSDCPPFSGYWHRKRGKIGLKEIDCQTSFYFWSWSARKGMKHSIKNESHKHFQKMVTESSNTRHRRD